MGPDVTEMLMAARFSYSMLFLFAFLTLPPQPSGAQPGKGSTLPDPFLVNSVWSSSGQGMTLRVLERNGETFRGRFVVGEGIERVLNGTVKGKTVSWLAENVQAIKGSKGGDNTGTIEGDRIDFEYKANDQIRRFTLRRSNTGATNAKSEKPSVTPTRLDDSTYEHWLEYIRPKAEELEWMKVDWRPFFWKAVIEAQQKDKPMLIYAMTGNPCGFT